jgi:hypothetical protein
MWPRQRCHDRADAGTLPESQKGAREMAKMQASMFGLTTKDEIEQFIEAAEDAALEHLEILKEIE